MPNTFNNQLLRIIGPFAGLADSDLYWEFADRDENDEATLREWIRGYLVETYRNLPNGDKASGMEAVLEMSRRPRADAERFWDRYLPPFDYPKELNLFGLIHKTLAEIE